MTVVKKLPDGSYKARPIIDGKKMTVRAATKKEVERQVSELREKKRRRRLGLRDPEERAQDITYDELCEKVLAQYPHTPQAKRALAENLKRSRDEFGNVLIRELMPETIQLWLARLPLRPTTKRNSLKAMRYALARAAKWGYLPSNIAQDVEMPPEPTYEAHPFESWEEVRSVAGRFESPTQRALVIFACATGLRPQEWRALEWRDIDIAARRLTVNRTVQDGIVVEHRAKTRGSLRAVRLSGLALEALRLLPTPLRREQRVFPGERAGLLDLHAWRRGPWKNAVAAAGLTYREPYGMRDTFATLTLADGAPLEWISEQMGHGEIDTTRKHYTRWLPTTDDRILDAINTARSAQTGLESDSATAVTGGISNRGGEI